MGMYTELTLKVDLNEGLPEDVNRILRFLFDNSFDEDDDEMVTGKDFIKKYGELPDHEFFKSERWSSVGSCNSFYHVPETFNHYRRNSLFSRSDLKNYDCEIEKFLDWLLPYISKEENRRVVAMAWYEEDDAPTCYFFRNTHKRYYSIG